MLAYFSRGWYNPGIESLGGIIMNFKYEIIRSARKTFSLQVGQADGRVIVRAPLAAPDAAIDRFVRQHAGWVAKQLEKINSPAVREASENSLSLEEVRKLADEAMKIIPERVKYYAGIMGVRSGKITIRNQRTRWGSCSAKGNLNFNCLLMLTPPEVIDSVVVHELCHMKHMDHSPAFYEDVRKYYPEYDKWNRWLKENGAAIMAKNI